MLQIVSRWFSLLLCMAVIAGCMRSTENLPTSPPVTPALPVSSAPPTATTTLTPTAIETPFTATPSSTITLMAVDTLEPVLARATIEPLLQAPMNCDVPCFWGIIPGKTSFDEARIFFSQLGFTPFEGTDRNSPSSGMYFYTIEYDTGSGHLSSVTLYVSNNMVENIILRPDIPKPIEGSPRQWIVYSPETLITRYGSPSRVDFTIDWQQSITINMTMYIDAADLIVNYFGIDMNPWLFCPLTAPFSYVRLWMGQNPPHAPSFESVPLEEATSLTMDQFTQLMLGYPDQACFALNEDAFP